jgi:hypothetical protein
MSVSVINQRGKPLMPCSDRKARVLLKQGRAKIVSYMPFVIQLTYQTGETCQPVTVGIDTGAKHIGVAVTTNDKVISKGEIELRQDVKSLLETRKIYRRSRRNRKTRYRRCKFKFRTKRVYSDKKKKWVKLPNFMESSRPKCWLPPSIQSRVNNTINWINKFCRYLPEPTLVIEIGKFDMAKLENPDVSGTDYQQGIMYGYRNRISYLLAREEGKCQLCKEKHHENDGWRLHHIWGKSKDRPQDWALLHESCHKRLHQEGLEKVLQKKKSKSYKESTFMNVIRLRLFKVFPDAEFTYGNITFQDRIDLGLPKTHYNDAVAISGIKEIKYNEDGYFRIKQFRKKKRSLHEATARKGRKEPNRLAKRNNKNVKFSNGFYLNDKVMINGKTGWITGFDSSGCYIKDIDDNYVTLEGKNYKQVGFKNIKLLCNNNNWQFIPHLKEGDFLPKTG